MKTDEVLLNKIITLDPVAVIATGSFASNEHKKISDIELAVIFYTKKYKSMNEIRSLVKTSTHLYPFRLEEIESQKAKVPFPNKFYFWWIAHNSIALFGENVFQKNTPKLTQRDWEDVILFEKGIALSAMLSLRNHDQKTANWGFSKSCLFAIIAQLNKQEAETTSYTKALEQGLTAFPLFKDLIQKAMSVREGNTNASEDDIFQNFKFLDYLQTL